MKRIMTYALAATLALGSVGAANAVDLKVKGRWDFAFGWADNIRFSDHESGPNNATTDPFLAAQRVRTQINFIVSEQLQGVLQFEIGDVFFGHGGSTGRGSGGALGTDGVNVETKHAYLDWIIPQTEVAVRMGLQPIALPNVLGSPILDDDVAGVTFNAPINDMFGVTAFWARPYDTQIDSNNTRAEHLDDEMDLFGLIVPVTGEGWKVTPWAMYGQIGNYSTYGATLGNSSQNTNTEAWWAGTSFELSMFDPLTFKMDVMYGDLHQMADGYGSRGWFTSAALDYKLDWATPGIFGWWASGDGDNGTDGVGGQLPGISASGFAPTSFGFDGRASIGTDGIVSLTGTGTWGVGLQLADMSFVEDLSHTLRVAYYQGTNDHDGAEHVAFNQAFSGNDAVYLTDKDYGFEVNFDHKYKIYENLTAIVELGYVHLELDDDVWGDDETEDAWKAQLNFKYTF